MESTSKTEDLPDVHLTVELGAISTEVDILLSGRKE